MTGYLLDHWRYTWPDVWSVLARSRKAPADLFVRLYRTAYDFLQDRPRYKQLEMIVNDPNQARQAFEAIRAADIGSEAAMIGFLEAAFDTLGDFEIPRYELLYKKFLLAFIRKYNLRYQIAKPFRLYMLLPGVFADLYSELGRINHGNPHLAALMDDFEYSFGAYFRSQQRTDLKTCILKATMYAEGAAAVSAHSDGGTLGELCDKITCWPHKTVKECLKKLYGFCSDYPGIRHLGHPKGQLRDLESRDAILICLLLLSFSGYLTYEARPEETIAP